MEIPADSWKCGKEVGEAVRTREKDWEDFEMKTAGWDLHRKEGAEPEAEDRTLGTCSLIRQQEEVKEEGRGRGMVRIGGRSEPWKEGSMILNE